MPTSLSSTGSPQLTSSSRMRTPANMAEIKFVVLLGDVEGGAGRPKRGGHLL